jgi:hypothetical protein
VRLFEVVPGAELAIRGSAPGAEVVAAVELRTNRGREATWRATATSAADGTAMVRVPFSTGENGAVVVGRYRILCGETETTVSVPALAVENGGRVDADCSAGGESR